MRNGNKKLATTLVTNAFESVKRLQLEHYHKATSEAKDNIELDPFVIFHRAVDNCTPILQLRSCKKGGITYQVILNYELCSCGQVNKIHDHFRFQSQFHLSWHSTSPCCG